MSLVKEIEMTEQINDFKEERSYIFQQLSAGELTIFEAGQLLDSLYLKYEEIFPEPGDMEGSSY